MEGMISPVLLPGWGGGVVAWLGGVWTVARVYGVGVVLYRAFALLLWLAIWWGVFGARAVCEVHAMQSIPIGSVEGELSCGGAPL